MGTLQLTLRAFETWFHWARSNAVQIAKSGKLHQNGTYLLPLQSHSLPRFPQISFPHERDENVSIMIALGSGERGKEAVKSERFIFDEGQ